MQNRIGTTAFEYPDFVKNIIFILSNPSEAIVLYKLLGLSDPKYPKFKILAYKINIKILIIALNKVIKKYILKFLLPSMIYLIKKNPPKIKIIFSLTIALSTIKIIDIFFLSIK